MSINIDCVTFGVTCLFKNSFNIINLYYLLPIVVIKNYTFIKKKQIPYFGSDKCIISIVPNKKMNLTNRGVRTLSDEDEIKALDNTIGIDFQCLNKNIHLKISSSKINITGSKDIKTSEEIVKYLIEYINLTDNTWKPFFILDMRKRYDIINEFMYYITYGGKYYRYGSEENNIILEKLSKKNISLIKVYDFLSRYTLEFNDINLLYKRLMDIARLSNFTYSLFHDYEYFNFIGSEINLGVYTCNLGLKDISLFYLSNLLIQDEELKNDLYSLKFSNLDKKYITMMAPVKNYVSYRDNDKSNKIISYLFHIYSTGNIKLFSSAPQSMVLEEIKRIYFKILNIINSSEYLEFMGDNKKKKIKLSDIKITFEF
jgi:hypothetical protein